MPGKNRLKVTKTGVHSHKYKLALAGWCENTGYLTQNQMEMLASLVDEEFQEVICCNLNLLPVGEYGVAETALFISRC